MLLGHQDPSFGSEDSEGEEEQEPHTGMWQIRSMRNVYAVLLFTGSSSGMTASNIVHIYIPLEQLKLFFLRIY
jgi:hypothetical protein